MDTNDKKAITGLMKAVIEAVMEADDDDANIHVFMGVPGGILYAALMTIGCSLDQFNSLMGGLVNSGAVIKKGPCYFVTPLGKEFVAAHNRISQRAAN